MLEGNVTRAAARIGLAQSSMSNALARLRLLFDDQLFARTPVGMHPTEKARAIAPLISSALAALRSAINDAGVFEPASSTLTIRLATSDYGEFIVLPKVMMTLRETAPNMKLISVPFSRSDVVTQMARGDIDIAFNVMPRFPSRIRWEPLLTDQFVCIARSDHPAITGALDLKTFLGLQQALVAPRGTPNGAVDRALAAIGEKRDGRDERQQFHQLALSHCRERYDRRGGQAGRRAFAGSHWPQSLSSASCSKRLYDVDGLGCRDRSGRRTHLVP